MAHSPSLSKLLEILRQQVPFLAERYSVESLEVFGSYVRSKQQKDSDLDILVTFKEEPSLLTFIAIENHLSDLLGVKVDLVMKDSLKPGIGKIILRGKVPVNAREPITEQRLRTLQGALKGKGSSNVILDERRRDTTT